MQHHAYIYEGSSSLLPSLVEDARARFAFVTTSPDVQILQYEKFGIDEARELQSKASFKSVSGHGLFVITISQMTSEAQQALLKLFEEPQGGLIFVLLVPHGMVIPTLRSRFLEYPFEGNQNRVQNTLVTAKPGRKYFDHDFVESFLSGSQKDRSDMLTKMLKDEEGLRERVRDFLDALEQALRPFMKDKKVRQGLEDIAKVRSYLADRSPSLKMLLEHLAISLPQTK